MNQFEIQIQVAYVVMMNLLDGEIERGLVAFVNQEGQDINARAERLAEERGAVLLQVDVPQDATLFYSLAAPERSGCNSQLQ